MQQSEELSSEPNKFFAEIADRNQRAKNIIIHNLPESSSVNPEERIQHDKTQAAQVLSRLEIDPELNFKIIRIGKKVNEARPAKLIFPNSVVVSQCMKNKRKLLGTSFRIAADRTPLQRKQIKDIYNELNRRKENGEPDLIIRYLKGEPFITRAKKNVSKNEQV